MSRGEPLIRQWNLLKAMQAVHYGLSADDLAERLECSKRQVLRDLKILQELGFPVSFEEREFGEKGVQTVEGMPSKVSYRDGPIRSVRTRS